MSFKALFTILLVAAILSSCAPAAVSPTPTAPSIASTATALPSATTVPTLTPVPTATPRPRVRAGDDLGFLKGMNYISWVPANYGQPLSDLSLKALSETGTQWVSINVSGQQDNRSSTNINKLFYEDAVVTHAIQTAHDLGMNVMLKVSLSFVSESEGAWGGSVGEGFGPAEWDAWFASYSDLVLHYARLAEENGVEMICIGTELGRAQKQTGHFTKLVADVRQSFQGPVTYAADWSDPQTEWWDQLDYIGIDAYYQLSKKNAPGLPELETAWEPIVKNLEALSKKWNRPLIFTEVGFNAQERSACNGGCGGNMERAELGRLDPQTQANVYQSLFNAFRDQPWFRGTFWWAWGDSPYGGGMCDPQYTPQGKLAENVLRAEYGAAPAEIQSPVSLPVFNESRLFEFTVFDDQFVQVQPDIWGSMKMEIDSTLAHTGNNALKFDVWDNGGGFSAFLPTLNSHPYQWLEFYVYVEKDVEVPGISVFVGDKDWQEYYFTDLTRCRYLDNRNGLRGGEWNRVLIPLEEIAADQRILNSVSISNGYPGLLLGTFWVDDIRFVGLK